MAKGIDSEKLPRKERREKGEGRTFSAFMGVV
jgi:hypothetical protein